MDLSLAEEQEALKQSVHALLENRFPAADVRACEVQPGYARTIYGALAELGLGGILAGEARGGLGMGLTDMVVVQVELGYALVPQLYGIGVVASVSLLDSCEGEVADRWLSRIVEGSALVACAFGDGAVDRPEVDGAGRTITGDAGFVAEPAMADALLVMGRQDGEAVLCLLDPSGAGVSLTDLPNLADQPMARLTLANAPVVAVLATGNAALSAWARALARMRVAIAAQAVGGAQHILAITRDYATTRSQFGQPIGGFQAIAHMLADAAVNIEGACMLVYRAAAAADDGEDFAVWAEMAKMKACQTYRDVSAIGIQVHGGIGFTLEADPQLYYRRAKFLQMMLGGPLDLQEDVGAALLAGEHRVLEA